MNEKIKLKERRRENLNKALAINSLDGVEPSKHFLEMAEKYVNGEVSAENMANYFISKYKE